jgi:hypothetical protein
MIIEIHDFKEDFVIYSVQTWKLWIYFTHLRLNVDIKFNMTINDITYSINAGRCMPVVEFFFLEFWLGCK